MTDDLRTLAQAVVDAWSALAGTDGIEYLCAQQTFDDASDALEEALECGHLADADSTARAILAALDAANAQGYARAIGEVDGLLQQRIRGHRDAMLDRMPQYSHDIRQGAREEATEIREWLQRRLPAAAERD